MDIPRDHPEAILFRISGYLNVVFFMAFFTILVVLGVPQGVGIMDCFIKRVTRGDHIGCAQTLVPMYTVGSLLISCSICAWMWGHREARWARMFFLINVAVGLFLFKFVVLLFMYT